ncbi:MAG: hypothetical protein MUC63_09375, partial [Planctomycetes bacterium]|nr:hypothetical protein [Planctomycetota bacterium]
MRRAFTHGRIRWAVAVVLAAAAVGVHLGMTVPARRQRDEAREAFARAREERERLRAEAKHLERRAAATVRAPSGDAAAARALRLSLLGATHGLAVESLRIGVEAGLRGAAAARGTLAAVGRQADLLRLVERLALPSSGVVVEQVRLAESRDGAVRLELEAFSVRAPADVPGGPARPG